MAALTSPSPAPLHSGLGYTRRYSSRAATRNALSRAHVNKVIQSERDALRGEHQVSTNDSSDDEDLAPIRLSAEAQAILGEGNSHINSEGREGRSARDDMHGRANLRQLDATGENQMLHREGSPVGYNRSSTVNGTHGTSTNGKRSTPAVLARDGSFAYKIHDKSRHTPSLTSESETPAPRLRKIRVSGSRSQTKSPTSGSAKNSSSDENARAEYVSPIEEDVPAGFPSTIRRTRRADENGAHSTMRVRRIGAGTLLNGPVRRGMIRRQSDDNEELVDQEGEDVHSPEIQIGRHTERELTNDPDDDFVPSAESPRPLQRRFSPHGDHEMPEKLSEVANSDAARPVQTRVPSPQRMPTPERISSSHPRVVLSTSFGPKNPTPAVKSAQSASKSSDSMRKPAFKLPSLPPMESRNEQELEAPPTFKQQRPSGSLLERNDEDKENIVMSNGKVQPPPPSNGSPGRQPLAARSNNTPRRPAPAPPPKMSLVEAATSNAGNSRSKKSVHYVLNGRTYRRLDCIGRGGSSRVFRIMAENYKIFALKRVNLEEADMAAITGYKGEIDLLKKLENVDRVIRLFDYEINEDKGVLSVMMELGESDFNKMLNEQLKGENAKLDVTFTRHYWKEMLECVQAVHDYDIVHSDLKPANFLLVKGQLKLIDFGIANAIQDDTVNVHRENQIGTPNYMSPESLVAQNPSIGPGQTGTAKILKLGKPSDVWSLGCILYQMTYGQPPFAHIAKQFERIMSIPNPKVEIQFPSTGIGGTVVPFGLIKTLRRCLQRDQTLRPTTRELLSEQDPFLNPVAISPDMLGRVIGNVVSYCRKREQSLKASGMLSVQDDGVSCLPKDEEMRGWPVAFYDKLRQAQEEGTAW